MALEKPVLLITGAAGRSARRRGERYTVVGFELDCRQAADCIDADITDAAALATACQRLRECRGGRLASVIHLAAFYDFSGEPDER